MTKLKHKILSLVLSVSTVLGVVGSGWFATPVSAETGTLYTDGILYYTKTSTAVTISDCVLSATSVTIPSTIDGLPVRTIDIGAFKDCAALESVVVPDSVITIKDYAFSNCTALNSISVPSSVINFGCQVFFNTPWLLAKSSDDPLVIINGCLLDGSKSAGKVIIPNTVKSICGLAFYSCSSLTGIEIPCSVTSIDELAFYQCVNLADVTIPSSVLTIEYNAFRKCSSLKSIAIPSSVKNIGCDVFLDCSSLERIDMEGEQSSYSDTDWGQPNTCMLNWNIALLNQKCDSTKIIINVESSFYVSIPQTINVDKQQSISYDIKVYGDVAADISVAVFPNASTFDEDNGTSLTIFSKVNGSKTIDNVLVSQPRYGWFSLDCITVLKNTFGWTDEQVLSTIGDFGLIYPEGDTANIEAQAAMGMITFTDEQYDELTAGEWTTTIEFSIELMKLYY